MRYLWNVDGTPVTITTTNEEEEEEEEEEEGRFRYTDGVVIEETDFYCVREDHKTKAAPKDVVNEIVKGILETE
jgi:hypothetical protein